MKTLKEKIEIMQAALDGAEIWFKTEGTNIWYKISDPVFSWEFNDYKVKPKPVVLFGFIYSSGNPSRTTFPTEDEAVRFFKTDSGQITKFQQVTGA